MAVALITGGTRGLGRAIGIALAEAGHIPCLLFRENEAEAEAALDAVRRHAPKARTVRADVTDPSGIAKAADDIRTSLGPIGILVNNAFRSGRPAQKTHELDVDAWREDIDVNLTGQFIVTRTCLPHMIESKFGRVVFIGSLAQRGEPGRVAYATVKAALAGFAKTLAHEYARFGITANVVSPGFIETGSFVRLPEAIQERARALVPSRRAGRPEEVAGLVVHLVSELGAFTTGQVIGVDGGTR